MNDVPIVQIEDLEGDLKEFLFRAHSRSNRQNLKKVMDYNSKMKSERSVYNRVPLDGNAVISIYNSRDKTFDLIKRLMKLVMCQEVLLTLRDYLKVCNCLEIRLQSLIYHIAQCPQYDLEMIDITRQLAAMESIVTKLESVHGKDDEINDKLIEARKDLKIENYSEEDKYQEEYDENQDYVEEIDDNDEYEDALEEFK